MGLYPRVVMIKYMTEEEQGVFWVKHAESHKIMEEDFNKMPRWRQLNVLRKMKEAHDLIVKTLR